LFGLPSREFARTFRTLGLGARAQRNSPANTQDGARRIHARRDWLNFPRIE
jgi:hypothetical protein